MTAAEMTETSTAALPARRGHVTPDYLIFRDSTGAFTARSFSAAIEAVAAEFGPDAWAQAQEQPGCDPVGDAARTLATREGLEYVGTESGPVVGRWLSWADEREHIRRTDPDAFARLENVERLGDLSHITTTAEMLVLSDRGRVEDEWRRRDEASLARDLEAERERNLPDWLRKRRVTR